MAPVAFLCGCALSPHTCVQKLTETTFFHRKRPKPWSLTTHKTRVFPNTSQTMSTPFPQVDFESLAAQHTGQDDSMLDVPSNYKLIKENPRRLSKEDWACTFYMSEDSIFFKTDDVSVMINACTPAEERRSEYRSTLELGRSDSTDQSIYDPPRPVSCLAPPKRFFRCGPRLRTQKITSCAESAE